MRSFEDEEEEKRLLCNLSFFFAFIDFSSSLYRLRSCSLYNKTFSLTLRCDISFCCNGLPLLLLLLLRHTSLLLSRCRITENATLMTAAVIGAEEEKGELQRQKQ